MGQFIELKAEDGHVLQAYHAKPTNKEALGGLVVIQEIFGVNSHIRNVADLYAEEGFEVLAPALFDRVEKNVELGYNHETFVKGREYVSKIGDWSKPLLDIDSALNELRKKYTSKVATMGFCWGGSLSWLSATRLNLACAVVYYGGHIQLFIEEKPKCPILMHFGDKDPLIPNENVELIRKAHPEALLYVYPAGHGFNCDERGDYDSQQAEIARERSLSFLRQNLA